MSDFIRLALLACVMTYAIGQTCGSKVDDLRTFYFKAANSVLQAAENVFKYLPPSTDDQTELNTVIRVHKSMEFHIQACKNDNSINKTCTCFNVYKEAFLLMSDLIALKWMFRNHSDEAFAPINQVYKKWTGICPKYQSRQKVSLFYILNEKYLSYGLNPQSACCDSHCFVGERERNFFLRRWDNANINTLVYGDVAAVGYQDGLYLTNAGDHLNWHVRKLDSWERFRVENGCYSLYEIYGIVHMCDLVMFHAMDDGNYFKLGERTSTHGNYHYAILDRLGNIPHW